MRRSASTASESGTNLNALLLIGSIRWFAAAWVMGDPKLEGLVVRSPVCLALGMLGLKLRITILKLRMALLIIRNALHRLRMLLLKAPIVIKHCASIRTGFFSMCTHKIKANVRGQAGRAKRVQHATERRPRPCLHRAC
jgi:hypothetical protein